MNIQVNLRHMPIAQFLGVVVVVVVCMIFRPTGNLQNGAIFMDIKCWFICIENTENQFFLTKFIEGKKNSCKYIGKMYFCKMTWFQKFFIDMIVLFFSLVPSGQERSGKKIGLNFFSSLAVSLTTFSINFHHGIYFTDVNIYILNIFSYDVGESQRNSYIENASITFSTYKKSFIHEQKIES